MSNTTVQTHVKKKEILGMQLCKQFWRQYRNSLMQTLLWYVRMSTAILANHSSGCLHWSFTVYTHLPTKPSVCLHERGSRFLLWKARMLNSVQNIKPGRNMNHSLGLLTFGTERWALMFLWLPQWWPWAFCSCLPQQSVQASSACHHQ